MEEIFYVYEDITNESLPRVFYIGKGKKSRVACYSSKRRNRYHANISQKYGMTRRIILETTSEAEALALEVKRIKEARTCIYSEDFLFGANLTLGGEGLSGHSFSDEHRKKISEAKTGKSPTLETKKKMSESARSRSKPVSIDTRAKLSKIHKGRTKSDKWKESVRLACVSPVVQIDRHTNEVIATFDSIKAATLATGATNISSVCRGLLLSSGGYKWKYVDNNETNHE